MISFGWAIVAEQAMLLLCFAPSDPSCPQHGQARAFAMSSATCHVTFLADDKALCHFTLVSLPASTAAAAARLSVLPQGNSLPGS